MESSEIQELVKILIRQRDSAMSRCAEFEAHLIIVNRDLEKYKNEEEAQDLFKSKGRN
jgi:hypothetical protein